MPDVAVKPVGTIQRSEPLDELEGTGYSLEKVVEIVCDSTGQLANGVHLLSLTKRFLNGKKCIGSLSFRRDVPARNEELVTFRG